jgi:molybdopterin molybdotransferase
MNQAMPLPKTAVTTAPSRAAEAPANTSKLLSVQEAQSRIMAQLCLMPAADIAIQHAMGRVCADNVLAKISHPPVPVSAMDGYACRSADVGTLPVRLRRIGTSRAGEHFDGELTAGACVRIFTGGAVPEGADVIAIQEDTTATGDEIEIREVAKVGQYIRRAGLDFAAGQICVEKGRVLTARDIGLLAASGHMRVPVRRQPRIAILSTGDELVAPGIVPGPDQIVSSNGAAIAAAVAAWGAVPIDLGIAPDRIEAIAAAVGQTGDADMLVTTGGASVGDHDLVQGSLTQRGFVSDFWRIAMRPGKPLMFGRLGDLPVLTMPGNPVSALVCALLFLRPALRTMLGLAPAVPAFEKALLGAAMPENDRREDYVRATLDTTGGGEPVAHPFPTQDSAMLMTLAKADALIRRVPFAKPTQPGDEVEIIRLDAAAGGF